jgi:hypothetical protein
MCENATYNKCVVLYKIVVDLCCGIVHKWSIEAHGVNKMTFLIDGLKDTGRSIIFLIFIASLVVFFSSILCGFNLFDIFIKGICK